MSGKSEVCNSNIRRIEQGSLRSSVSDSSLTAQPAVEPQAASPQSFAALKQAYDFMLPHYKALQAENRNLHKEKDELKRKLSETEALSIEMSIDQSQELPDGLRSKGQSNRTLIAPVIEGQGEPSNEDPFRVSPCGGLDSAINLNDGTSFTNEKGVREERLKWLLFSFKLLLHFPENGLGKLVGIPDHCLVSLDEFILSSEDPNSEVIAAKLEKLKSVNGFQGERSKMRTSQLAISGGVDAQMGSGIYENVTEAVRESPTGKSLPTMSDEDPSDEDIYTSGFPTKGRGRSSTDADEDNEHEWVRVDNAVDILEKCASYIHQSLEVHSLLKKKIEEDRFNAERGKTKSLDTGRRNLAASTIPNLPPLPNRTNPPAIPVSQARPFDRRLDHLRQFPSTASDPGKASSALSQLNLGQEFYSDPLVTGDPRYNSPKKTRRPRSVADVPTPLQELSVKYPPLPYGAGISNYASRNFSDSQIPLPPDCGPVTMKDNNLQFQDGQTYQPCGPPEVDDKKYKYQEEDDFLSWNAARNPDMFEQTPTPVRFSRSEPNKRFVPSSGGIAGDSYGKHPQLPRSSDRIYDMDSSRYGPETLTNTGFSTGELGRFGASSQGNKLPADGPVCPVCHKQFEANTPEVAVNSHVNLHFENERNQFEIIE